MLPTITNDVAGNMKKTYTRVPRAQATVGVERLGRVLAGGALFPLYWLAARHYGLPGLRFGISSFRFGLRSLLRNERSISYSEIYRMLFAPVESTRYFEFGMAWEFLSDKLRGRYLDVSSPRLFPLSVLAQRRHLTADFVNPNHEDLGITAGLVRASGLGDRCTLWNCLIEELSFQAGSFDLITSLSVVE